MPCASAPPGTVADAAGLASTYADRLLVRTTRDVHRAVSRRVLTLTRQRRTPVGLLHEGITAAAYGGVGVATRTVGRAAELGGRLDPTGGGVGRLEQTLGARLAFLRADVEHSPSGRRLRSIVNGLIGDVLRDQGHRIAITASVRDPRCAGTDVELNPEALNAAFPRATSRVVVFVHGLCEDDGAWDYGRERRGPSYPEVVDAAGRWTPVAVRYNSGLPIQQSARELVRLLDRLFDAWPVPVEDVAFVGHSMGGLVVRAAAAYAAPTWWAPRVGHVVLLGAPHAGAPLERLVRRAVPFVRRLPELAPFAEILDERSVGIRDLRDGIGVDVSWWPQAAYHCVGATLGATDRTWLGRVLGDLLVQLESARGTAAQVDADFRHILHAHHFDLLNHPQIAADLLRWLDPTVGPGSGERTAR